MIDRATVDRILETARIEEVISDFVALKKRGTNYVACCPFHHEKTPSFSVSPAKGIFKCFGCGKAGSAVTFVMEHEHMSYVEALKYLGHKYGIEVKEKEETAEEIQQRLRHESLMIVNEFAQKYYTRTLWEHPEGQAVGLSYFRERGFTEETVRKFQLGYALNERRAFTHQAQKAGYKKEYLTEVGLTLERENTGELCDRFYERVMFPIHSVSGKVIAFGGRKLRNDNKEIAKYINSPESPVYSKSHSLYGIFLAKAAIVREQKCYLVEGYTDVISFHQAGIENVVASNGTSLTVGQIALIKRFSNRVTVLYDGDFAGIKASLRGIDMLLEEGLEVKVALFPDGEDPDSFARNHPVGEIRQFLQEQEEDFIAFKYRILNQDTERDPIRRARMISEIIASIAVIPDPIVRTVYIEETAGKLKVAEELLLQEVAKLRRKKQISAARSRDRFSGTGTGYESGAAGRPGNRNSSSSAGLRRNGNGHIADNSGFSGTAAAPGGNGLSGEKPEYAPEEGETEFYPAGDPAEQPGESPLLQPDNRSVPGFITDTYCEEAEKELLYYLLKFGHLPIHLEEEFAYGAPPPKEQTVAQYLLEQLRNDDLELQNLVFKNIFDEYFRLEKPDGGKALQYFTNHPDSSVSRTVSDLLIQPYELTISQFTKSLIPEQNVLGKVVPKAVLVYKAKVTEQAARHLAEQLGEAQRNGDDQRQKILMEQLCTLMQVRNIFSRELKRITF